MPHSSAHRLLRAYREGYLSEEETLDKLADHILARITEVEYDPHEHHKALAIAWARYCDPEGNAAPNRVERIMKHTAPVTLVRILAARGIRVIPERV